MNKKYNSKYQTHKQTQTSLSMIFFQELGYNYINLTLKSF
jgi:hypothetical protein